MNDVARLGLDTKMVEADAKRVSESASRIEEQITELAARLHIYMIEITNS